MRKLLKAAEAAMTSNAWKLWSLDGNAAPGTEDIVSTLELVLSKHPTHAGANHYYIHAIEASPHPERGFAAAQRLKGMMPAAGHLEHMPAHNQPVSLLRHVAPSSFHRSRH